MEALDKKPRYPSKARVRQYVELARELGMDVAAFQVSPNGTIRVMEARTTCGAPLSDFERFKDLL
ncbi:hypothetical protein HNO88_000517 [Novosphingobium chloroacetimidivorans]|uniref:Uncharacterized protein n=1 Tax=Novosphingobium chloroacetimidivorans TaxID=1428314 RepID=A0A7W7NVK4_9SPHN|nr:hypothetical protein [Novosphingobium chloroacetimidivorans]